MSVEANALGVTSIETAQYVDHGDRMFELHGLDANDHEVGQVRLRIGSVTGLPGVVENDDHQGSELVTTVAGHENRTVSRQTVRFPLAISSDPSTQTFLEIPAVAATLAHDANIIVTKSQAIGEVALTTQTCPANQILVNPKAYECCYDATQTMFTRADTYSYPTNWYGYNQQTLVVRNKNPQGTGCRASNGTSTCSGKACYYGPQGYTVAAVTTPGNFPSYHWEVYPGTVCGSHWGTTQTTYFSDLNGSVASGAGCCVNGTGPCANGTACAACGGGSGNAGFWDY